MQTFFAKVVQEKEKKLMEYEFNSKLLHDILPCNKYLFKWKIRHYDICDVCQEVQTVEIQTIVLMLNRYGMLLTLCMKQRLSLYRY